MPCEQCQLPMQVMDRILGLADGKKLWSQVWRAGSPSDAAKASEFHSVMEIRSTSGAVTGAKLFVDGLPRSFDDQQLHDLFAVHGQVVSARILTCVSARLPLAGYVVMASAEEATRAIEVLDRTRLNGQWLLVGRALVHR